MVAEVRCEIKVVLFYCYSILRKQKKKLQIV